MFYGFDNYEEINADFTKNSRLIITFSITAIACS